METRWIWLAFVVFVVTFVWALTDDVIVQVQSTRTKAYIERTDVHSGKESARQEWLRFKECVAAGDTAQTCALNLE